jgi:hypothetical protein
LHLFSISGGGVRVVSLAKLWSLPDDDMSDCLALVSK